MAERNLSVNPYRPVTMPDECVVSTRGMKPAQQAQGSLGRFLAEWIGCYKPTCGE